MAAPRGYLIGRFQLFLFVDRPVPLPSLSTLVYSSSSIARKVLEEQPKSFTAFIHFLRSRSLLLALCTRERHINSTRNLTNFCLSECFTPLGVFRKFALPMRALLLFLGILATDMATHLVFPKNAKSAGTNDATTTNPGQSVDMSAVNPL